MIKLNQLLIDGKDYTDYAVWTLQGQDTLDESLDMQYIELKGTATEEPLKPFSDVLVKIDDNGNIRQYKMFVESDTVTEVISNKSYNHNLLFIEESKWLERLFVEKTIRQPLIHDYGTLNDAMFVDVDRSVDGGTSIPYSDNIRLFSSIMFPNTTYSIKNPVYLSKLVQDGLGINIMGSYSVQTYSATLKIYNDVGKLITTQYAETSYDDLAYGYIPQWSFDFTPEDYGSYSFEIIGHGFERPDNKSIDTITRFDVSVVYPPIVKKDDYTIRDTVNLLLDTCITLRQNEKPLFSIAELDDYIDVNNEYKKRVQEILDAVSPEFTFSKMSLWEALKMIGDYGHFVPRLKNGKIYFDLLGRMDYADIESLGEYNSNVSSLASNDFCNALDSQVNNLTNMDDEAQGSVSTPNNSSYRTLRTETGNVQITEGNMIIPTEENIEKIISLEIGYLKNGPYVGDITPFVYEEDEYNTLSSYTSTYPTSKMYAIKYKQGSKNITGLNFERDNTISSAMEGLSIKNIILKKLNLNASAWRTFWDNEDAFKLQYRLVYIPSTNTKITQHKPNKDDINKKPLYIAYNQSASKVSSNAYGENLKGTITKLGNIVKTKMYILPSMDLIPKCGTLFDKDYYISVVKYEVYPNFIKCELGLSKNYNNKSAYVEINSQLEFFEYNRDIIIDRYIVYEDFCEVGDDIEDNQETQPLITNDGIDKFANSFVDGYSSTAVSCVKAQGFNFANNELNEVVLPVISLGVGNSILLAYHYEDSISAGNRAFYSGRTRYQNFVKYTDIYGEVDTLKLKFGISTTKPKNYNEAVQRGDTIPSTENFGDMETYFDTEDNHIVIKKGVGEIPHFSYQLHFVSNKKDLIIGSGLTRKSTFTTSEVHKYKLYLLKEPINKFETKIDLTNATLFGSINITDKNKDYANKKIKLDDFVVPDGNYNAWAIVQTYNNQNDLIIGENKIMSGGDYIVMPTFKFKRRIK